MKKIDLTNNHRRSVSSAFFLIDDIIDKFEAEIFRHQGRIMTKIINDISESDLQHYRVIINKIRDYISHIARKYNLSIKEIKMSQIIKSRKAEMWQILSDTTSKSLKSYGDFPSEYIKEFDSDINNLLETIKKI